MATATASNTGTTNTNTTSNTSSGNSIDTNKASPRGVYKNPRLMHVSTTIVGCTVQLQTKDGSVWEGIFATFSPEFSICLDLAVRIDPKLKSQDCLFQALKNGSKAQEKAFFDLKDIVRITVNDVDLNYAIKEMDKMVTDSDISGFNSSKPGVRRELESWQDDDGDNANEDSLFSLDEVAISAKNGSQNNSRSGWDAQEMFRYNERVHKVNSTYDEDLHDYTIALPKPGKHDKDWRKKQDRAAAIAREIETNPQSQGRLAKEDGSDDEEEKFSSVIRPQNDGAKLAHHQQQQQHQQHQSQPLISQQQSGQQHQQPPGSHTHSDSTTPLVPPSLTHQHHNQHQQGNQQHLHQHQHQNQNPHHQQQQNQHPRQIPNRLNNTAHNKNLRPRYNPRFDSRIDSLKNFGRQLNIAPNPRQSPSQVNQMQGSPAGSQSQPSPQQSHQKQNRPQHSQHQSTQSPIQQQHQQQQQQQHHQQPQGPQLQNQSSLPPKQPAPQQNQPPSSQQAQPPMSQQQSHPQLQQTHHQQQQQQQQPPQSIQQSQQQQQQTQQQQQSQQQQTQQPQQSQPAPRTTPAVPSTTSASNADTSLTSERSDTSSSLSANQQSELAKKSTLNPNAKEFVYKPRSPASIQGAQANGANPSAVGLGPAMDPNNSSPMTQAAHGAYYQQVPIFSHGVPPHQQQPHHPSQFIPNHPHMHFQSQIHYMPTAMAPHFAPQQVTPRYIRGGFQNYHHRNGDHMNNVRAAYAPNSLAVPTSASGQPFVPSPSGAQPHHLNTFAMGSPQQSIVYGGPPQSVYPMAPANFHQPPMSHVPNPQTYEGYMPPTQNYVINQ